MTETTYWDRRLVSLAKEGVLKGVQRALAEGARVDSVHKGDTALKAAASRRDLPLMKLLIEAGADIDHGHTKGDTKGDTALLRSLCALDAEPCALYLVSRGASLTPRDRWGQTALAKAAHYGFDALVGVLLSRACFSQNDIDVALQTSVLRSKWTVARSLVDAGGVTHSSQAVWLQRAIQTYAREDDYEFIHAVAQWGRGLQAFAAEIEARIAVCDPEYLGHYEDLSEHFADCVSARRLKDQMSLEAPAISRKRAVAPE